MPITESALLAFEERAHDLAACMARIDDIVSGDALPLQGIVKTFEGTPHERAEKFSDSLVECCDLRMRAETHWLENETWGATDVDLSTLPSTMDDKTHEALWLLFYCAARLTIDSPWLENATRDFIDLAALPQPTPDAIAQDAERAPVSFSFRAGAPDWPAVFLASDPVDALERFAIACDLLQSCGDAYECNHTAKSKRHTPRALEQETASETQPARSNDLPFLDDEEFERQREKDEREFAESERRAFAVWRASFSDAEAFCSSYEKLRAAWRASNIPVNAGLLAREGLDMLRLSRGTSLYHDDATYYRAFETLQSALAELQRLAQGARA